ncbi:MAG: cation:proton antiporter [Candidatus Micrarchaeia archaeon]
MESLFIDIAIILALATGLAALMRILKQPIIIAYLLTGVSIPFLLGTAEVPQEHVAAFSEIGVALLLFIVGVKIDLRILGKLGKVSVVAGVLQMLLTALLVAVVCVGMGIGLVQSTLLGVALSFSSTAIVVKLLTDMGDSEKLHGQVSLGILLVQDIVAVLALIIASSAYSAGIEYYLYIFFQWVAVLASLGIISLYVLPPLITRMASSQELLFIFTVAWCFLVSAAFGLLGIGIEIGALLAGISLSTSQFQHEISARIKPLRDFFLIMFFVALGLQLTPQSLSNVLPAALALTALVMLIKLVSTALPIFMMGYGKRTAFLTGLSLSQVSEFSFILMGVGMGMGYIATPQMVLVVLVGLISITLSSYLIANGDGIYQMLFHVRTARAKRTGKGPELLLFGYNRIGYDVLKSFKGLPGKHLVVDYDPAIVASLKKRGVNVVYGDASDVEFLEELDFSQTRLVVSTIPDVSTTIMLLHFIRSRAPKDCVLIATAHKIDDAMLLYDAGADYVIMPHFLGGRHASSLIELHGASKERFREEKARHIRELLARKRMGHEHPTIDYKV